MAEAAMRSVFTRLGFTDAAARVAVNQEGYNTLRDLQRMAKQMSAVENLCKTIRRPGGKFAKHSISAEDDDDGVEETMTAKGRNALIKNQIAKKKGASVKFKSGKGG